MGIGVITCIFLILIFSIALTQTAFAETERLVIAARSYEQISIYLNQGDELNYSVSVSGGIKDDIDLTIFYPGGGDDGGGRIYDTYTSSFVAKTPGNYVFSFSNTFSLVSNKSVNFTYERIQNTYFVYVRDLPNYAKNYAANAVYDSTEFWKKNISKKQFFIAKSESNADIIIQWVRDFGGNQHIGFQYVRLIEVGLGDSDCYGKWKEYSSSYVIRIMTHEIGHAIGFEHSNNPNAVMYPSVNTNLEKYSSQCVSPQTLSIENTVAPKTVAPKTVAPKTEQVQQVGGGCLIATATFGSELAPQVQQLREIRDNSLLQTELGSGFMKSFNQFYYSFSPTIADLERENPLFKEAVKLTITPLLSSLSLLNYVDMDSESEVLGYGISLILLNVGMYFVAPALVLIRIFRIKLT